MTDDSHSPPITAAELASKLHVSRSIISNKKRRLGKLFQECCEEQGTKTPRISYDELWPIARESARRSKQEGAEDKKLLNSVDDLIKEFM